MNHESIDENGINENAIAAGEAKRDDWAVGNWNIPTMPILLSVLIVLRWF